MTDLLIPLGLTLLGGLVGLTIYVLAISLRESTKRIADMNERLMVLLGTRDGGEAVGRALVASSKTPRKPISSLANKKKDDEKPKSGVTMTYGNL
jgi:hypothetical protein